MLSSIKPSNRHESGIVTPSSPDFHVHDGDTEEFGQLHEDRILGERGGVVVGVRVAQTPEAGPVVDLPRIPVLLQPLLALVHHLLEQVLAVGVPGRGGGGE